MDSEVVKTHKKVGWHPKKYEASITVKISGSTQFAQFPTNSRQFYFHSFAPNEWCLTLTVAPSPSRSVTVSVNRSHSTPVITTEGRCTVEILPVITTERHIPSSTINKDVVKGLIGDGDFVFPDANFFHLPPNDLEFGLTFRVAYTALAGDEGVTSCKLPTSDQLAINVATANDDLFHNGIASDVSFLVGDEEIKAHVAILVSRVPYFERMMSSGMVESQTKSVKIEDADPATFKLVLRHIYCGKIPDDLQTTASKVLPLADKYDLSDLRDACMHWLEKSLSKETVCDTLITADLYRCHNLKKKCLESLSQWKSSMQGEAKSILLSYPNLLMELVNIV